MVVKSFYSGVCCCCKKNKDTNVLEKGQGYLDSVNEEIEVLNCLDNPNDKKNMFFLKN